MRGDIKDIKRQIKFLEVKVIISEEKYALYMHWKIRHCRKINSEFEDIAIVIYLKRKTEKHNFKKSPVSCEKSSLCVTAVIILDMGQNTENYFKNNGRII